MKIADVVQSEIYAVHLSHLDVRFFVLQVRIARIFNTYGPRMCLDDGRVVSNFVAQVNNLNFLFHFACLHFLHYLTTRASDISSTFIIDYNF